MIFFESSITDVMRNMDEVNNPDKDLFNKGADKVQSTVGTAISVVVYIFFALLVFTTSCDLLYIVIPFSRKHLYNEKHCLISKEVIELGEHPNIKQYFKKRVLNIILIVVIFLLLVTTNLFTDLGFNIGELIVRLVKG